MSRPGWGYHWTPCDSGNGPRRPGICLAGLVVLVLAATAGRAAAPAIGHVLHVLGEILTWMPIVISCIVGAAVIAGGIWLGRTIGRTIRWMILSRSAMRYHASAQVSAPVRPAVTMVREGTMPAIEAPRSKPQCTAGRIPARRPRRYP